MAESKKKSKVILKMGRPTDYCDEIVARICETVAAHPISQAKICAMYDELPDEITIRKWRFKYPDFALKYREAKRLQAELYAEETIEISNETNMLIDADGNQKVDPGHVAYCRNRMNARQWHAAKLAPKVYGDKLEVIDVKDENAALREEILALRKKLEKKSKKDY